jgi:hypothetical protein
VRVHRQNAKPARPDARHKPAARPGTQRILMPDIEAFTDREDSLEVKELTRDLCDVYAAQLADDDFQ